MSLLFTFQYVSINTTLCSITYCLVLNFTFQYVSINTHSLLSEVVDHKLYIPICFY